MFHTTGHAEVLLSESLEAYYWAGFIAADGHMRWMHNLKKHFGTVIKRKTKNSRKIEHYLGCSLDKFFKQLESQWEEGMSWSNYGKGPGKWDLDHIRPCKLFDLSKEKGRLECFNHKNLRAMWWRDNLDKGCKFS